MQKIMFNERYGLTKAVLQGSKTMTRRMIKPPYETIKKYNANFETYLLGELDGETFEVKPCYYIGEVVAIAQSYKDVYDSIKNPCELFSDRLFNSLLKEHKGWNNKMFVKAEFMPHRIRITDVKVERLQDISVLDCLREGIVDIHLPILYPTGNHAYTFDGCSEGQIFGDINGFVSPIAAFAALIDKVSGRGTWDRNPWVFAYTFEIVK